MFHSLVLQRHHLLPREKKNHIMNTMDSSSFFFQTQLFGGKKKLYSFIHSLQSLNTLNTAVFSCQLSL